MTVPTSELQSWLASQCDGAVPTWEITADSLALLSSVYRRHKRREEEARLELEELEVAREEYEAETERLSSVLRGAGSGVADSLQQGPAQSYADSLSSACSSLQLDSSLGSGLHCKLAELVARKADNIPALGKIRTDVDSLRSRQLGLHETLSRATELLSAAAREEKEKGDAAASRNSKGEFMSKKCQEYRRSHQKLEAVLAKNGGNDPRVKHSEISSLRSEVSRLEEEQQPLARQCSAFATLPPSLELAKARLADAQGELEALESSLSGAITELQL